MDLNLQILGIDSSLKMNHSKVWTKKFQLIARII